MIKNKINYIEYSCCWQKFAEELTSLFKDEGICYLDILNAIYWAEEVFKDKIKERYQENLK